MQDCKDVEPDWKKLEILVAEIQRQLSPDAVVKHNVMLDGIDSEAKRQIDVLVEQRIGQYNMRIIIDCKDYASPIDVKGIEEFQGLIQDVRAQKGAMVCPRGFTKSAKKRAKKLQIDLFSPVDTGEHKWKVKVTAPVVCDFRSIAIGFRISSTAPKPFMTPYEFYNLPVFDESGKDLGTLLDVSFDRWNKGELPTDVGIHDRVKTFGDMATFVDNGYGDKIEVELSAHYQVKQQLYLGFLGINEIRGLKDEHTGAVVTNAFTTDFIDPLFVQNNWKKIESMQDLRFEPIYVVQGLYCYGVKT